MTRLVNDLIDLSALESGAFRLIEQPVDLVDLVMQTVDSLRLSATAKGLDLTLQIDVSTPRWVTADAERLREILINLIANAIKFTDAGRIVVSLRPQSDLSPEGIELIVADTGPGISPKDHARVFEPFSRLDLTAHREGVGLGLALVTGLCRTMNGTISLESEVGQGSRFLVRLPLALSAPPATESVNAPDPSLRGRHVLIVDDNALVRELFSSYLTDLGVHCSLAVNGEDALRQVHAQPLHTMILDLALPKLNGFEVARQLRASGSTLLIIGVSAHTDVSDRNEALAAGMDMFLTKPVELAALGRALANSNHPFPAEDKVRALQSRLGSQFRETASTELTAISDAHARADWAAMAKAVHHLKNSATAIGDESLQAACAKVESALRSSDPAAIDASWSACTVAMRPWLPA